MKKVFCFLCVMMITVLFPMGAQATRYYVTVDAKATGTGQSWDTPMPLATAIQRAVAGDELWLLGYSEGGREHSYVVPKDGYTLKAGVRLYGGFAGTETDIDQRAVIDGKAYRMTYRTVLTADISRNDAVDATNLIFPANTLRQDNATRVLTLNLVRTAESGNQNQQPTVVDGITIARGHADGANEYGGGIYVTGNGVNYEIRRCFFIENYAALGGALYVADGVQGGIVDRCGFFNNAAGERSGMENAGGAISLRGAGTVVNTAVFNNENGGILLSGNNARVINSTVVRNTGAAPCRLTPAAAVPIYGRSADNIRDHRNVTSMLHRIWTTGDGVFVRPTMSFDERGHRPNSTIYYVCGYGPNGQKPAGFYPTVEDFVGEGGTYLRPRALAERRPGQSAGATAEGREAMGAFRFPDVTLAPGEEQTYVLVLGVAASETAEKGMDALAAAAEGFGIPVERIGRERLKELLPWIETAPVTGAIHMPTDAFIDSALLCNGYARAARRLGVELRSRTAVREITHENGAVTGVVLDDGSRVEAPVVIDAAGAWSNLLSMPLGIGLPMTPVRSHFWITEQNPAIFPAQEPFAVIPDARAFTRPDVGGLIIGIREPVCVSFDPHEMKDSIEHVDFSPDNGWETLSQVAELFEPFFPAIRDTGIAHYVAGPSCYVPDAMFVVGPSSRLKGFFAATGCCGGGVACGGGIGRLVAELVMGTEPFVDPAPFCPERFGEVDPFDPAFQKRCADARSNKKGG